MPILRPILLALLFAALAATMLMLSHGARAETYLLGVFDGPPPPHGPHHHHRPPPPRPAVEVVEPAPPLIVVPQPAPTVVAVPAAGTSTSAAYCREFQSTMLVDGQPQPSYGIACRQPDGAWKIVNQTP
ncbi:hypothetical protein [Ferrovibrio sp.]|uniref:hypothetical protein n=1 Tax=Ferrovibrio sp. TaxID=1917215 RepID=UPI002605F88E|nr:hypothetical protein [Ferrovibrio sp.]